MQCSLCHKIAVHRCKESCGFIACDHCKLKPHTHGTPSSANRMLFDEFFRENSGAKLFASSTLEIDTDQLNTWESEVETSGSPEEIVSFAHTFAQHLTHITFYQFRSKLNEAAHEIRRKIEILKPNKVYLVVDGDWRRSNIWIALLCWSVLRSVVTDVVTDPGDVSDWQRTIAIHLGDASLDGEEIYDELSKVSESSELNSRYFILVPYLGSAAKTKLATLAPFVKLLQTTVEIKTLKECLELDGYDSEEVLAVLNESPWKKAYTIDRSHSLIYFDHEPTAPSKVLTKLPVLDADGVIVAKFRVVTEENQENAPSPLPFYKTIKYTFRGSKLKEGNLFAAFDGIIKKAKSKFYSL